jgi:hypothetical protein
MFDIEAWAVPGLFIFLALGFWFLSKGNYFSLFSLLIMSFGMNAFTALAGTLWFPYKVVMIPIILFTIFKLKWATASPMISPYYGLLILSVGIAWTTGPAMPGTTFLQGPVMRPLVQLYTYAGMALIVPFILFVIYDQNSLKRSLKMYFRLSEIIILFGLLHLVFLLMGLEFIPILRPGGEHNPMAAFGYEDAVINRIYGISGEPKTLATFILPYVFISIYNYLERNFSVSKIYHLSFIIISSIVMIYTFSSALLMSAAIALPIVSYLFRHRIRKGVLSFTILIGLITVIFGQVGEAFLGISTNREQFTETPKKYSWSDILYERSFGRVEKEAEERFEMNALTYISREQPEYIITGFGLGMYNYHLPLPRHNRGLEPIDSGWVVVLMDLGILGLIYFFYLLKNIKKLNNFNKIYNNVYLNSYLIGVIVAFIAHIGNNALYQIFLFLGLALAAYNIMIQDPNTKIYNK